MTEPGIGSDLASMSTTAVRDGDDYVVNGSKTFITNGINADLVITAVKTDAAERHRGMSLLVIERDTPGFERGRNLDKIGMHAQDTAELFFTDARVPVANRLGDEGTGFVSLVTNLPQERLSIAITGVAAARRGFEQTLAYVKERTAFGQPIGSFQNSRFRLAEMATEIEIAQTFADRCVLALNDGELTAEEAAMAKWWCTELQGRVLDARRTAPRRLRLHDGVSDRPRLRGCQDHAHLRRHDRDHEGDHRPCPRPVTARLQRRVVEIDTLDEFDRAAAAAQNMRGWRVRHIDLRDRTDHAAAARSARLALARLCNRRRRCSPTCPPAARWCTPTIRRPPSTTTAPRCTRRTSCTPGSPPVATGRRPTRAIYAWSQRGAGRSRRSS